MIHLLTFLHDKLAESGKQVYYDEVPEKDPFTQLPPKYPYIVYRLGTSINVESDREDFPFIINVWDNAPDTSRLEQLTSTIDKFFYKQSHIDEYQFLKFERASRSMVPDTDPAIKRRQLRYTVKYYER